MDGSQRSSEFVQDGKDMHSMVSISSKWKVKNSRVLMYVVQIGTRSIGYQCNLVLRRTLPAVVHLTSSYL